MVYQIATGCYASASQITEHELQLVTDMTFLTGFPLPAAPTAPLHCSCGCCLPVLQWLSSTARLSCCWLKPLGLRYASSQRQPALQQQQQQQQPPVLPSPLQLAVAAARGAALQESLREPPSPAEGLLQLPLLQAASTIK
jgi:hypothetical protein